MMLKIDLHIHSIHSGHAYGTLYDIIREAKSKGLEMIAITDHGPSIKGSETYIHFSMGYRAPKNPEGVILLWGCEANIIDGEGSLDVKEKWLQKLDFIIVGLHKGTAYKDLGKEKNTEAIVKCFSKHHINCFSHPTALYYDYDIEKVCQAACDNDILLELNLASLSLLEKGAGNLTLENLKRMVDIARRNSKKLLVNSDAHFLHEIGDDSVLDRFKDKLGLDDSMIINNFPDELKVSIKMKKERRLK